MILFISRTTRPDWMAKVEEYLGRPFNQDIFADCTNEVEDQLKEQLAESEAAADKGFVDDVWDLANDLPPRENEERADDHALPAGWQPPVPSWLLWDETVAVDEIGTGGDSDKAVGEENEGGEQLLEADGVEEGPDDECEIVAREKSQVK